jgi:hypothetical protein
MVVFLFTQGKGARIDTATFIHGIEPDDYTNKRYVDKRRLKCLWV